ncbi:hypothetical protein DAH66_12645 [Sphingomonas koreensis]|uniref:Uncharacterized protein n=1 Tax=Sphingomonas koreensis TaxID=93064 RepID=A0A430G2B6_9SPHN|nr:hypothetical protein [Sphingomonas koreensis]RSY83111.1 hypothetical protein DAH66_12645 [Sphingomonas koreensis]
MSTAVQLIGAIAGTLLLAVGAYMHGVIAYVDLRERRWAAAFVSMFALLALGGGALALGSTLLET